MAGLNCHFVSRFLTRPWEYGQRQLSYYDFEQGAVRSASSKTLFAVEGANTREVEARLDQVIETPISQAITTLVDTDVGPSEDLEWPVFRALSLLLMLQPLRSSGQPEHGEQLEETVMRTDDELDELAQATRDSYHVGRITLHEDIALLYPAAGFFPLIARRDDGNWGAATAMPVGGRHAFVAVPRSMDWASATAQWSANGAAFVGNASVGTSNHVVIPVTKRRSRTGGWTNPQIARRIGTPPFLVSRP